MLSSLVGGISGGLMAVVGAARQNAARRAASSAVNDAYIAMAQDGMFSDRAAGGKYGSGGAAKRFDPANDC